MRCYKDKLTNKESEYCKRLNLNPDDIVDYFNKHDGFRYNTDYKGPIAISNELKDRLIMIQTYYCNLRFDDGNVAFKNSFHRLVYALTCDVYFKLGGPNILNMHYNKLDLSKFKGIIKPNLNSDYSNIYITKYNKYMLFFIMNALGIKTYDEAIKYCLFNRSINNNDSVKQTVLDSFMNVHACNNFIDCLLFIGKSIKDNLEYCTNNRKVFIDTDRIIIKKTYIESLLKESNYDYSIEEFIYYLKENFKNIPDDSFKYKKRYCRLLKTSTNNSFMFNLDDYNKIFGCGLHDN